MMCKTRGQNLSCVQSAPLGSRSGTRGFTLIEVMITVAIIAILASVALPAYNDYIRRGQQAEAFNALADFRAKMEQYYQDNRNYGSAGGCATDSTAASWNSFTATQYFTYSCAPTDTSAYQTYLLTATGSSGQVNGDVYRIDQNGNRTTTIFKGASVTANCWLTRSSTC
jgi:type IV pilus assembly protein PilE